jgi:hypothetical protein
MQLAGTNRASGAAVAPLVNFLRLILMGALLRLILMGALLRLILMGALLRLNLMALSWCRAWARENVQAGPHVGRARSPSMAPVAAALACVEVRDDRPGSARRRR